MITWNLGDLAPGSAGTVQFGARSDSLLANGTLVTNTAHIFDAVGKSAASTATTRIGSAANLALTDDRDTVQPGDLITYTVTFSGVEPLNNGRVQIDLPANTIFVRASTGYVNGGDATYWFLAPQPANFYGQRYLVAQVLPVLDNGTVVSSTAYLSGDGQNSRARRQCCGRLGSRLELLRPRRPIGPRSSRPLDLTYTVDLHNTGSMNAHTAVMTDTLPAGVTYENGSVAASSGTATYDCGQQPYPLERRSAGRQQNSHHLRRDRQCQRDAGHEHRQLCPGWPTRSITRSRSPTQVTVVRARSSHLQGLSADRAEPRR